MAKARGNNHTAGKTAETVAALFLTGHGCTVLDRNFRDGRAAEIDLIAEDGDTLVFAEVKYRSGGACGTPEEAVTSAKQAKIRLAAEYYLYKKQISQDKPVRFDVVCVEPCGGRLKIRWIRDAFR